MLYRIFGLLIISILMVVFIVAYVFADDEKKYLSGFHLEIQILLGMNKVRSTWSH
jgi:hypothetical protein